MSAEAPLEVRVGLGSCGLANGARPIFERFRAEASSGRGEIVVKAVGCGGACHREPLVEIVEPDGRSTSYDRVRGDDVAAILDRHREARRPRLLRFLLGGRDGDAEAVEANGLRETRIVLENCGVVDPASLEEALARGAWRAFERCRTEGRPDEVIEAIERAGLRGRGGAGFPTGRKWRLARERPGPKVVVCNGDEGDPGAFMDRLVLESDPHRVVEGLAIAAWAVGAERGFFYVRAEYPQAVARIREAILQAEEAGFLRRRGPAPAEEDRAAGDSALPGEKALPAEASSAPGEEDRPTGASSPPGEEDRPTGASSPPFDEGGSGGISLEVREGAGAFVCGEETALIASLEGRRGTPRLRPPYPVESGYRGRPTLINNVETLAAVPWILLHGPEAFAALGTESSRGTKVFALAGKVRRGGLIEVPMGITIREIVEGLGGGTPSGRPWKAVQLGGPSGGCLPARLGETPIDYEALAETGAIMGSGGLVVLDERDCMVDVARFFLHFTQQESCGKCTYCRVGTQQMAEILDRLCEGRARPDDVETLELLADRVRRGSLCGLGQTAPNPVLSALRWFRDEVEAHLEGRCPAGRCPALVRYRIDERCIGCTLCAQACPVDAIRWAPLERHSIDESVCTRCDLCFQVCPEDAVEVVSP